MRSLVTALVLSALYVCSAHAEFEWTRTHTGSLFDLYSFESGKASGNGTEKMSANGWTLYGGGYNSSTNVFYECDGTVLMRIMLGLIGASKKEFDNYDMSFLMFRYGGGIGDKFVLGLDMDYRMVSMLPVYKSDMFGFGPFVTTEFIFLDGLHWWPLMTYQVMFTNRQEEPVDGTGFKFCNHFIKTITERWGLSLRIDQHWRSLKLLAPNEQDILKVKSSVTQISFGIGYSFD